MRSERRLIQFSRSRCRSLLTICIVAATTTVIIPRTVEALMVGAVPGVGVDTSMNPATPGSGWTQGDPGFANVAHTAANLNAVYIGDGWMLSAWHTGVSDTTFIESGQTLNPIPGQDFPFAASADLRMFRINGDPALLSPTIKPITIATLPLAVNDQVMFIANGLYRDPTELHWNVTTVTGPNNDIWTQVGSCGGSNCFHGYGTAGYGKRWGTNTVEDDQAIFGSTESDANITIDVNGTTTANIAQFTKQNPSCGSNCFETQVISGDSGSAVFHKRGSVWELAGISTNIYSFDGQNTTTAVYGDVSAFADLSSYSSQIASIISAHQDYSAVGDINLDGTPGTTADIAAFVAGWRYNNGTGAGTITSWKNGDLTHDGKVDVDDFLRFRSGISAGAGAELAAAMGNLVTGAVPEPSSAMLVLGPIVFFALRYWRWRLQTAI